MSSSEAAESGAEAPVTVRFCTADTAPAANVYVADPTRPSVLLLTQNLGGLDAQSDLASSVESSFGLASSSAPPSGPSAFLPAPEVVTVADLLPPPPQTSTAAEDLPPPQVQATNVFTSVHANTLTTTTTAAAPATPLLPQECSPSTVVTTATVPRQLARWLREFVTELRLWLHRAAFHYATHHSRANRDKSPEYSPDAVVPMVDVIVIQFQEIGGKCRHAAFNEALERLLVQYLLPEAGWNSGFLMEHDASQFSAIGSIILLSPRVCPVTSILSIPQRAYIPVLDDPRTYGDSARYLFHHAKFSSAGKSRKGFLLVSLRVGTVVLNICNLHNFHDVDNRLAMEASPSCYATRRLTSVLEAVAECLSIVSLEEPFFLMGDYNTRLDGMRFVDYLREQHQIEVQAGYKELRCPDLAWELFGKSADGGGVGSGSAVRGSRWHPFSGSSASSSSSNPLTRQPQGHGAHSETEDTESSGPERDEERLQQLDTLDDLQERFDVEMDGIIESVAANFNLLLAEFPKQFPPTYSRLARRALLSSAVEVASEALLSFIEAASPTATDGTTESAFAHHKRQASFGVEASGTQGSSGRHDRRAAGVPSLIVDVAKSHPFVHDRFPAWCDRILFNASAFEGTVAGLGRTFNMDGSAGEDTKEHAQEEEDANAKDEKRHREPVDEEAEAEAEEVKEGHANTYLYNSCSLIHTDHDGVFLLF